jgi:hypothetical protein
LAVRFNPAGIAGDSQEWLSYSKPSNAVSFGASAIKFEQHYTHSAGEKEYETSRSTAANLLLFTGLC